MEQRTNLFGWFEEKERTFTIEEVEDLVRRVKVFNAGAIDDYLTKHVDKVLDQWLSELKGEE